MKASDKAKVKLIVNTESPAFPLLFLSSEVFYGEGKKRRKKK